MKIRIDKKKLYAGVKIIHEMVDLKNNNSKVVFYYFEDTFVLIDYSDNKKLYTFFNYCHFRKRLSGIVKHW